MTAANNFSANGIGVESPPTHFTRVWSDGTTATVLIGRW